MYLVLPENKQNLLNSLLTSFIIYSSQMRNRCTRCHQVTYRDHKANKSWNQDSKSGIQPQRVCLAVQQCVSQPPLSNNGYRIYVNNSLVNISGILGDKPVASKLAVVMVLFKRASVSTPWGKFFKALITMGWGSPQDFWAFSGASRRPLTQTPGTTAYFLYFLQKLLCKTLTIWLNVTRNQSLRTRV